jgi:hypothetical protein
VEQHAPVHFPRRAAVGRHCLLPAGTVGRDIRPGVAQPDRLAVEFVIAFEDADALVKLANDRGQQQARRAQPGGIVVEPVNAPKLGLRVEQAQRHADKTGPPAAGDEVVEVAYAAGQGLVVLGGVEGFPFVVVLQAFAQSAIVDPPAAEEKIEIADAVVVHAGTGAWRRLPISASSASITAVV